MQFARLSLLLASFLTAPTANAATLPEFGEPGVLLQGTGEGYLEEEYRGPHILDLRFPLEVGPAFANSQVYAPGGSHSPKNGGGQCSAVNFSYPWRDNFCESRSNPKQVAKLCPKQRAIHMGQDIRAASCEDKKHWVVAPEEGIITSIGSYSVRLRGISGYDHMFLHMASETIVVARGQKVVRGQRLGLVSDNFGTKAPPHSTTVHLHYEIRSATGLVLPPYATLVESYRRLINGTP